MDLKALNNIDLRSIDLSNIGTSPLPVRIGAIAVVCAAILGAGYYFDTSDQRARLAQVEAKEQELRNVFETKQKRAANLEAYKEQLEEMRRSFGAMLKQLPSKTEIPNLIVDISQTGLSSGLEIDLFRPKDEVRQGFYAEKPIELKLRGGYQELGAFVSGVAGLPRIVTLHDVSIKPDKDGELVMEATAKTYRYLDAEE